jgi:hypothetical protein
VRGEGKRLGLTCGRRLRHGKRSHASVRLNWQPGEYAHLTISGAAGESHERYEPITQFGRGANSVSASLLLGFFVRVKQVTNK